jgi:DNA-binding MarR family transcriptional regulator
MTRPVAEGQGLTPARFDLMYAIYRSYEGWMTQATLRRALGVSAPTVSRMLRSLEELGLVFRTRARRDRRTREVMLTHEGRARVRAIHEDALESGAIDVGVESLFGFGLDAAQRTVDLLYKAVSFMARKLGDGAFHWHYRQPPVTIDCPWLDLSPICSPIVGLGVRALAAHERLN